MSTLRRAASRMVGLHDAEDVDLAVAECALLEVRRQLEAVPFGVAPALRLSSARYEVRIALLALSMELAARDAQRLLERRQASPSDPGDTL